MRRHLWERMIAVGCAAIILATSPSGTVFADEIQEKEITIDNDNETIVETNEGSLTESDPEDISVITEDIQEEIQEDIQEDIQEYDETLSEGLTADDSDLSVIEGLDSSNSDVEVATSLSEESHPDEEIVGATTLGRWTVGDNVTATIFTDGGKNILYFTSNNGTLWEDWKSKIGYSFENINTIYLQGGSSGQIMHLPTDSSYLFKGLSNVETIIFDGIHTDNVTKMNNMFSGCKSLTGLDLRSFDTSKVTSMAEMFGGTFQDGFLVDCCVSLKSLNLGSFNTARVTDMEAMFRGCSSLTGLDLNSFNTSNVQSMKEMFAKCENLKSMDLSNFNTRNVRYMDLMFEGCKYLTRIDLHSFDTSNVRDLAAMFDGCCNLKSLDLSSFSTLKANSLDCMFNDCSSLSDLNLDGFDTSCVTSMGYMFDGCTSLTNLDISSLDVSKVTKMRAMFRGCYNLEAVNMSGLNTSAVTDMGELFSGCSELKRLDLVGLNTSNVIYMDGMFEYCNSLSNLDLSGFNTSKVTNMSRMFHFCSGLTYLDISGFDTSYLTESGTDCMLNCKPRTLVTPKKNTKSGIAFAGLMWDSGGKSYDELPVLSKSIVLTYKSPIGKCEIMLSPASYTYDGNPKTPSISIRDDYGTLVKGKDYEVSYSGNVNAGTAVVLLKGIGSYYYQETERTFSINKASPVLKFAKSYITKNKGDTVFTNTLTKKTDGTVTYKSSNTAVATVNSTSGAVTIKGIGTATITATASEGKNYLAGKASYTLTVTDAGNVYTIAYDANGGTGTPSSQTKKENVSLTLSSVRPTKKYLIRYNSNGGTVSPSSKNVNCTFKNWNTQKNGGGTSYASGSSYTANTDATLYAQWKNPTAGEMATPTRSGFTFIGWFTSATGGNEVKSSSTVNGDITLYAHWTDPYNLGDETYSFANYSDSDSWGGHCFGMSMTSSGYKNNKLDIRRIGGNANTPLYSFNLTSIVKEPICYYQGKQGYIREKATVAGGSKYLNGKNNIASDWSAVVNYVKNHKYDYTGLLQIGFRKEGQGGHAINFLYYKNVNGQDRIYAYDNNFPKQETYFYQDSYGRVYEAPVQTFNGAIDCIALRDIRIYFDESSDFDSTHVVYMEEEAASIQGYDYSYMEGSDYVMYEIPADQKKVTIIPKKDNADFIYADTEYSFGNITDETRGELTFSSMDVETGGSDAKFVIYDKKPANPTVTLSKTSYTYDGAVHKPTVTVKIDGTVLKSSQDYTVEYPTGMINVGVYKVKVTLKGKYEGILYASYEIKRGGPNDLGNASVGGVSLSYGYAGKSYTPTVTVKLSGVTLTKETDYTVKYENNVTPGTATITVTGKGKYTGRRIKTFEIVDCVSSVESGKTYLLIPKNNAKTAVCAVGGKMVNNTKVYITDRGNSESQKFKAVKNSDGTWKFINAKCELALAVQQNSSALGAGLVLYDQTTKPAQNWNLSKKSDNSFAIINSVTGYSIAMSDKSAVKGTTLSMAETASVGLQRFYIVETSAVSAPFDGTKSIRAAKDKNFAVNIASASKEDGANVSLYTYTNSNARKFKIIYSGGGYYRLVNVNSGLCLTIKDNSNADGANIIQSKWKGYSSQRWKITKNSDGTVTITNMLGTVLHLLGNRTVNNTNIHARKAASTTAQKWYLN